MTKLYWRPARISRLVLILIALAAGAGMFATETIKTNRQQPYYRQKLDAAKLADRAMKAIKAEKLRRRILINQEHDPARTGMVGLAASPVTSNTGHIEAKQASANPNFAAMIVHQLKRAKVKPGDRVAVSYSGSFPALNIAVLAALQTLQLDPVMVTSVTSSQWGANDPRMLWIDMEKFLYYKGIFRFRSRAAALGGIQNRGIGIPAKGREILMAKIQEQGLEFLEVKSYDDSVEVYMNFFEKESAGRPYVAYINVGGGTTSVGRAVGKKLFRPGLNMKPPPGTGDINSVMMRYSVRGVPVIHLVGVRVLAERFGFPYPMVQAVRPGDGRLFFRSVYNTYLAGAVLALLLLLLYAFIRTEWGLRLTQKAASRGYERGIEPTI